MRVVDPLPPSELRGPLLAPTIGLGSGPLPSQARARAVLHRLWEQAPVLPPVYWILQEEAPVSLYLTQRPEQFPPPTHRPPQRARQLLLRP